MKRPGMLALAGVLAGAFACAGAKPVPSRPSAARLDAGQCPTADAHPRETKAISPNAGSAPGAAAPTKVEWKLIDSGRDERGRAQVCDAEARFTSLAKILAAPAAGPVAIRGRVWMPATYPCTAAIPEVCFATPVLAARRPTEGRRRQQIFLNGYLAPDEQLACLGPAHALRCPIPVDGREYGVTGTLRIGGYEDSPLLEVDVDKICRFETKVGR